MAEKPEKNPDALKITNQSRSRTGFIYDLKCNGQRLVLNINPRQNSGDENEWCVEARKSTSAEASPIAAWGKTRIDALREVGRQWNAQAPGLGVPSFDWEAVATALTSVSAL